MRRDIRKREEGFTLVELLAAIIIMGMLGIAVGGVLIQLQRSSRITQEMTAVRQVQAAGDRVSMDGLQAQFITLGTSMTDNDGFLRLSWTGEWADDNGYNLRSRSVTYTMVASGSQYDLHRIETCDWTIDGADVDCGAGDSVVARHLDADEMSCEWIDTVGGDGVADTETFSFTVVSTVGTKTEERTYNVSPRPAN